MEKYKPVFQKPKSKIVESRSQQQIRQQRPQQRITESKRIPARPRIVEKEKVHIDSVVNLSDQIKKYLDKHGKDKNVNSVITDIAIGLYLGVANYYANDNDESTSGVDILDKIINKTKALMKEHPELDSEKDVEADFDLEGEEGEAEGETEQSDEEYPVTDQVASKNEIEEEDEIPDEEDVEDEDEDEEEDKSKKESRKKFSYSGRGLKLHTEAFNRVRGGEADEIENINLNRFLENDSSVDEFK